MGCAFCPQGESTGEDNRLARITWPAYQIDQLMESLKKQHSLKRLCLQVVQQPEWLTEISQLMHTLSQINLPLCVSCRPANQEEVDKLFAYGVETLSIPLDACTEQVASSINRPFKPLYEQLISANRRYPGKVNTHLIIGLGESEKESIELIEKLVAEGINVALFAFTPIKGTKLASHPQPQIGHYRRVQAARYLRTVGEMSEFVFTTKGYLKLSPEQIQRLQPIAFETSGCPDCNRPYYNERPGQVMYNYPWPLSTDQFEQALSELREGL